MACCFRLCSPVRWLLASLLPAAAQYSANRLGFKCRDPGHETRTRKPTDKCTVVTRSPSLALTPGAPCSTHDSKLMHPSHHPPPPPHPTRANDVNSLAVAIIRAAHIAGRLSPFKVQTFVPKKEKRNSRLVIVRTKTVCRLRTRPDAGSNAVSSLSSVSRARVQDRVFPSATLFCKLVLARPRVDRVTTTDTSETSNPRLFLG